MKLVDQLFGSKRQNAVSFLFPLVLMLLVLGTIAS
jgi:hypothetical protein